MAWMDQEKKAKIAANLKAVVPKTWKYTLSVRNHSTIVMTIKSAPVNLVPKSGVDNWSVNHYHLDRQYDGKLLATFKKILSALNTDNHDNSDIMTDYFDVGHYVDLNIGLWNKPFVVK